VERLLEKSHAMAGRIEAGNREVLERTLDPIVDSSIERAFGGVLNESVLTREEQLEVIQRAIESDPAFREMSFLTPLHHLVEQLGGNHDDLAPLDQASSTGSSPSQPKRSSAPPKGKLLPHTIAIARADGNPGVSARDEMLMYTPMRLGLDENQSMALTMVSTQLRSITDSLTGGTSPLGVVLGQIALLRHQLTLADPGGEPRIRDLPLDGPAREYRDTLLQDMGSLERTLGDTIGFGTLNGKEQDALLDAYIRAFGITDGIAEGSVKRLGDSAPGDLARLREDLEVLSQVHPQDEKARALLETVRAQAQSTIALLETAENLKAIGATLENIGQTLSKFTLEESRLLRQAGVGIEIAMQYKEKGIPIHPRTLVREFSEERVVGEPRLLGGGQLSKPYEVGYGDRTMVFKEAKPGEGYGPQSTLLGIGREDSRMAVRNLTTKIVDEMLKFDLVPETAFGTLEGQLGIVMDFARGAAPSKSRIVDITDSEEGQNLKRMVELFPEDSKSMLEAAQARIGEDGRVLVKQDFGVTEFDFTDPKLRRELVKLQLLDALCAQGDRHPGNYVVELGDDGRFARLKAIDNDQAFGPKMVNPNQLLHIAGGAPQHDIGGLRFGSEDFNGVLLPGVVDREMKKSIDGITPESLREKLAGLLPEREIEATILRLHTIKTHLAQLERAGMVIGPDEWGGEKAGQALESGTQSYVGRESGYIRTLPPITYQRRSHERSAQSRRGDLSRRRAGATRPGGRPGGRVAAGGRGRLLDARVGVVPVRLQPFRGRAGRGFPRPLYRIRILRPRVGFPGGASLFSRRAHGVPPAASLGCRHRRARRRPHAVPRAARNRARAKAPPRGRSARGQVSRRQAARRGAKQLPRVALGMAGESRERTSAAVACEPRPRARRGRGAVAAPGRRRR
jgi:hypothetical protein